MELCDKLILITEKPQGRPLSPKLKKEKETIDQVSKYYINRKVEVETVQFNFGTPTKPILELVYLIYKQKAFGFDNITVNISNCSSVIGIWFYFAAALTNSRVIHANYKYDRETEVGIINNESLTMFPISKLSEKQFEILSLFLPEFNTIRYDFLIELHKVKTLFPCKFTSLEKLTEALKKKRNLYLTRGAVNGLVQKLRKLSALNISVNPENRKERIIEISYIGIAYFLRSLYNSVRRIELF